jgi:anti-anti-sigma factor
MPVTQSRQKCRTAEFTARWGPPGAVIAVSGELDAANADQLGDYVQACLSHSRQLIVDMRDLEFIGTAGFSTLHRINVMCSGADAQWAMVPGAALSRLLRICDPDATLPVTDPVMELPAKTKGTLRRDKYGLLQLVAQSG